MGEVTDSVEKAVAAGLLPAGQAVLAACSGGADSVALAAALAARGDLRVAVGHVDHGLRPESAADADHVRDLARRLGVPFFVECLSGLRVRQAGLEAAAREGRYAALARLAGQAGCALVATAHTRRDQAETVLLRLLRGAGPGALAGVRRVRDLASDIRLVRPLLDVPRSATEAYCRERELPFLDDPHNVDPARARARLRALWPLLAELNPRLDEALAGAAELFADEDELLEALARSTPLKDAHPALQRRALLAQAVAAGLRPERRHLEALRAMLARRSGSLDLPGGRASWSPREKKIIFFSGGGVEPIAPGPSVAIEGPGRYPWGSRELTVAAGPSDEPFTVDLARAPFPWTLRSHRPGDRFRPAGGRTRKVADLWIDARIPRQERKTLALLEDAEKRLFWVEGVREGAPLRGVKSTAASFGIR
ncbi:MAG TPA: tRNA lysidine(34) synthetase TilS [Myxococcales bacterium]|nr:tRNA lysidine(34) synthetase TilS [Myxococcales bacterium]